MDNNKESKSNNAEPGDIDVDYLHPQGKPFATGGNLLTGTDSKPDWRSYRLALAEADGHSMKKYDPFLQEKNEGNKEE